MKEYCLVEGILCDTNQILRMWHTDLRNGVNLKELK